MMDFETIKQVFDGSFDNGSYVKITENQFDEFYRAHEMCWDNWSDAPESLCARWFETHYMNIQKDNNICFAIKYSACLSYIQNEEQIKDIYGKMPANVTLLIEKKRMDVLSSDDKVEKIKDDKEFIDVYLAKELSNKDGIGIKLFELANRLDYKNISLSFRKDNIKIRIKKINNEWIYYINEILSKI